MPLGHIPNNDAFVFGVGIKSFIQNSLDVGVVFIPIHITPGVEIDGIRVFRVHDDEGAVLVTAQNSSKQTIIVKIAKLLNNGNLRKHVMTVSE